MFWRIHLLCDDINIPQESSEDLRRWVLDNNPGSDLIEKEIIQEVTSDEQYDTIEETAEAKYIISCDKAMSDTNTLIRWLEEHELDSGNVLMLKDIQEIVTTERLSLMFF